MRHMIRLVITAIFLCVLIPAPAFAQEDEDASRIRFAHFVTDVPEIDVYLDEELMVDALEFGDMSSWLDTEPGSYTVSLTLAGESLEDAVLQVVVDVAQGEALSITVIGSAAEGTLETQVLVDDLSEVVEGEARIIFYHAIADAPAVNVLLNGDIFFQGVSFAGDETSSTGIVSADIVANTVMLQINDNSDPDKVLLDLGEVELLAGNSYFIAAVGTLADADYVIFEEAVGIEILSDAGHVRFAHLATGTPQLDFYIDDGLLSTLNLAFTELTEFAALAPGEYTISARAAGSDQDVVEPVTLTLEPGAWFTIAIIGARANNLLSLELLEEDFSPVPDGEIRMSVFHAMIGEGPVNVSASGTLLIQLLGYPRTQGDNDGYESFVIVAGNYDLTVRSTLTGAEIVTLRRARLTAGRQYFMALVLADPPFVYDFIELSEISGE